MRLRDRQRVLHAAVRLVDEEPLELLLVDRRGDRQVVAGVARPDEGLQVEQRRARQAGDPVPAVLAVEVEDLPADVLHRTLRLEGDAEQAVVQLVGEVGGRRAADRGAEGAAYRHAGGGHADVVERKPRVVVGDAEVVGRRRQTGGRVVQVARDGTRLRAGRRQQRGGGDHRRRRARSACPWSRRARARGCRSPPRRTPRRASRRCARRRSSPATAW